MRKKITNLNGLNAEEYLKTSMIELMDIDACYLELTHRLHPDGFVCSCGHAVCKRAGRTRSGFIRHQCVDCGSVYTILTCTPLSGTKLGPRELVLFMRMWGQGHHPQKIGEEIGMHKTSVADLIRKMSFYSKLKKRGLT